MEISTPREEINNKNIEVHLELNKREEELISDFSELDILKDEACNICKVCLDEYSLSVEKSICSNCKQKSNFNKKYNAIFVSGWLLGSVTTSFLFGFSGYACVTAGLSAGTILSIGYKLAYT
jgi:hypothetical protein